MKIVVDTNRIIAALIKDSDSRRILFSKSFEFIIPEHTVSEISKYEKEIIRKAKINHDEFGILLLFILQKIKIISKTEYEKFMAESKNLISDFGDVPFIALCIASKADGIWSDDRHFEEQKKLRIIKTKEMIGLL